MINDKLIAKIKKIPYGIPLSIIYRNNPEMLDACIALGRIDLVASFNEQAFTDKVLERRGTQLAQHLRKTSIENSVLAAYYFRKNDLRTAFKCIGSKVMTKTFLKKYGSQIIEGLKKPRHISHAFWGDSKLLYKYLLASGEVGLAFSDEFFRFNKNLIKKTGVSMCADAIEGQYDSIPSNLGHNKELFEELLKRKNYNLVMSFDASLLTDDIVNKYKSEFIETILKTGKVNIGVSGCKILADYFREQKNYKILVKFYNHHLELSSEEFETFVHEIDVSESVPSICKNNESLFKYYMKKRSVKILFQFDSSLIQKHDIFNRYINEIIALVRSSERIHLNIYLDDVKKIKLIEHDAVDVIIKLNDNYSYSLIGNDLIMNKYGEKVLQTIENLGLDVYDTNDPAVFKNLLKYKKFGYLLRANEKVFNKFVGNEYYPDLANYLTEHRDKFTFYIRKNKSFFNYCFNNKYYDLLLSFNYWFLTPKKASGIEDKIIESIMNDLNYPNLFRENEMLYYHLYDYALKNKKYDFIFEHCGSKVFSEILWGRYNMEEARELKNAYFERTGLTREEFEKRLKSFFNVNDEIFQTLNPMILSHKYDVIDEKELQRFIIYPDIQKRIVALNEAELKVLNVILKKINSKKVKIDRSNLISNVIKNLHKYENIIKEINVDTIDDDLLEKLICLLNDSNNYYDIKTLDELKEYDELVLEKFRIIEASLPQLNIFDLREAVFRKKFGISLEEARFICDRYCNDMQAVTDSELSKEIKIVLNEIKNVFASSKEELKFMFISCKSSISNKHKYDSLESIIRTNYAKLYNDCLYKPKEEDIISDDFKNKYFQHISVPVYMPHGDFNMQTHSLGAYREFHEPINWKNDWNRPKTTYHGICTTFISNEMIAPARSFHPIYGFTGYRENEMLCMGNYDLNSDRAIAKYDTSRAYPFGFYSPKHLINKTRHSHNEIVIERITNGVKRQPDYVVYVVDDANDPRFFHPQNKRFQETIKAAEDFNIPIVIVDRLQYAKKNMAIIESMKKEMITDFEKFANEGKVQELLFKYLNNRIGCIKYNIESTSEVYNYFTDEICIEAINSIWGFISEAPDSTAKCNALKQLIYVLSNEHMNWNEAKLDRSNTGWILNEANKMLSSIDSKYRVEDDTQYKKSLKKKEQRKYIFKAYTVMPEIRLFIKKDLTDGVDLDTIIQRIDDNIYLSLIGNPTSRDGGGRK